MDLNKIDNMIQEIKRKKNVIEYYRQLLESVSNTSEFNIICKNQHFSPIDIKTDTLYGKDIQSTLYQHLNDYIKDLEKQLEEDILSLRMAIATDSFGSRLCEVAVTRDR